jgi:hypothetical protein
MTRAVAAVSLAFLLPSFANALSWQFKDTPTQCQNLEVTASGGQPPYTLLLVPVGASLLPNNAEVRSVQQIQFNDSSSLSFPLRYPQGESFVAVVSLLSSFAA